MTGQLDDGLCVIGIPGWKQQHPQLGHSSDSDNHKGRGRTRNSHRHPSRERGRREQHDAISNRKLKEKEFLNTKRKHDREARSKRHHHTALSNFDGDHDGDQDEPHQHAISLSNRQENSQRQPQHEIEFEAEDGNNHKEQQGLFSFPWNWGSRNGANVNRAPTTTTHNNHHHGGADDEKKGDPKHHHHHRHYIRRHHDEDKELQPETESETDDSDEIIKQQGVPSVVFAIKDEDEEVQSRSSPTNTNFGDESEVKQKEQQRQSKGQKQIQIQKEKQTQKEPKEHNPKHKVQRPPDPPELPEEYMPIEPSAQPTVLLMGNANDPILCSESIVGGKVRHSRTAKGMQTSGDPTGNKPLSYRRMLKRRTIHDLTELESVSTYDLEQRHKANEVRHILASSNRAKGKDSIALPRLSSSPDVSNVEHPIIADRRGPKKSSPPGHIGNHIVYNLSESGQKVNDRLREGIIPLSESLEKMKTNLRHKQTLLTQTVSELKAKQNQQQTIVAERNPETVHLLGNQNYISDIFSDIASRMSVKSKQTHGPSGVKVPYIPKVSAIINAQKARGKMAETNQAMPTTTAKNYIGKSRGTLPVAGPQKLTVDPINLVDIEKQSISETAKRYLKYRHPSRTKKRGHHPEDAATASTLHPATVSTLHPTRCKQNPNYLSVAPYRCPTPAASDAPTNDTPEETGVPRSGTKQETTRSPSRTKQEKTRSPSGTKQARSPSQTKRGRRGGSPWPRSRHDPTHNYHEKQFDQDICNIAAPLTEQFGGFISPKSSSSLYLPNVQSQQNTPVVNKKRLPFRPSAVAASAKVPPAPPAPPTADKKSRFPSVREVIDVTKQTASYRFKNVIDLTSQTSLESMAKMMQDAASSYTKDTDSTPQDVIDVTSVASSRLSKLTLKNVTCVDEDSRGVIRAKRKLSAMPKQRRNGGSIHCPPTKRDSDRKNSEGWNHCGWNDQEPKDFFNGIACVQQYENLEESNEYQDEQLEQDHLEYPEQDQCEHLEQDQGDLEYPEQDQCDQAQDERLYQNQDERIYEDQHQHLHQDQHQHLHQDQHQHLHQDQHQSLHQDQHQSLHQDQEEEQAEETEIIFAPSKDAATTKSLFDGIWDIEIPSFFQGEKSSVDPSKTTGDRPVWSVDPSKTSGGRPISDRLSRKSIHRASPPISTLELKGPVHLSVERKGPVNMSRYSQEKSIATGTNSILQNPSGRLQPPTGTPQPKLRSPMEASQQVPQPKLRSPMEASPEAQGLPRLANWAVSPRRNGFIPPSLQQTATPRARNMLQGARDPSVLPWACRAMINQKRDAPIESIQQREPEGTVTGGVLSPPRTLDPGVLSPHRPLDPGAVSDVSSSHRQPRDPGAMTNASFSPNHQRDPGAVTAFSLSPHQHQPHGPRQEDYTDPHSPHQEQEEEDYDDNGDEDEGTEEVSELPPQSPKLTPNRPMPRASAFAKKGRISSERSTETRSVTFKDQGPLLSPTKPSNIPIPSFICTDQTSTGTGLSSKLNKSVRRNEHPWEKESQASSRRAFPDLTTPHRGRKELSRFDRVNKAIAARHQLSYVSRDGTNSASNGTAKRSMYDEVMAATRAQQPDVIILDDQASQQYEVYPADFDIRWDDFSGMMDDKNIHKGRQWGSVGDSSILPGHKHRSASDSASRSKRSNRGIHSAVTRKEATFFDFLCF